MTFPPVTYITLTYKFDLDCVKLTISSSKVNSV